MDRDHPNISTEYHPEGSDARPRDTLDREKEGVAPSTKLPKRDGDPVVDEKGRPITGDGITKDDAPVVQPSQDEQLPTES